MPGLMNIALTGLKAHQTALQVTGNNVANVNTEGYVRRRAEFEELPSQFIGVGYVGNGVQVADIERMTDEFLAVQVRNDSSVFYEIDKVRSNLEQLDDLLANPSVGISQGLSDFFNAMQAAADDPSSIPNRQLVISRAESLLSRFKLVSDQIDDQLRTVNLDIDAQVEKLNGLAANLAEVNQAIVSAQGSRTTGAPNELLDERDLLLRKMSEVVSIQSYLDENGAATVLIGSGQPLVSGNRANEILVDEDTLDVENRRLILVDQNNTADITAEVYGGALGGLYRFRDEHLLPAANSIGRMAVVLADAVNERHQLGNTLENRLGGQFFSNEDDLQNVSAWVVADQNNPGPDDREVSLEVIDPSQLTTADYLVEFTGPSDQDVRVTNKSTGETVALANLPSSTGGMSLPASITFDGLRLNLESGSFQRGDRYLISPLRNAARDLEVVLDRPEDLALASPIRTEANIGNRGSGDISQGQVFAVENPSSGELLPAFQVEGELNPPILVRFITDEFYEVLDNSDPANPAPLDPPLGIQRYIPGVENPIFSADSGATLVTANGSEVGLITTGAPADNGYSSQDIRIITRDPATGTTSTQTVSTVAGASAEETAARLNSIAGVQASASTEVVISGFDVTGAPPSDEGDVLELTIDGASVPSFSFTLTADSPDDIADAINENAELQDLNIIARSNGQDLTLVSLTGKDIGLGLTGDGDGLQVTTNTDTDTLATGDSTTIGGEFNVLLDDGIVLQANSDDLFEATPSAVSAYTGYNAVLTGVPEAGDTFTIEYNEDGFSDNRNALRLADIESFRLLEGGLSTLNEAYADLVEVIGSATAQAEIDSETAEALLTQSENRFDAQAGVNLDEEAALLIQYQAAYNANARVISIARELFDTLLGAF